MLCVALPLFPATSLTAAVTVATPSVSAVTSATGTPTLHLPSAPVVVVYVLPFSVTVTSVPALTPLAVPLMICATP
uniref:hypothetical protein n=1 Tax=Citrobacter sp. NCU1 TaxID=2026683 RepID=UPI001EE2D46E